jgi:hypothetical protein
MAGVARVGLVVTGVQWPRHPGIPGSPGAQRMRASL